MKKRYNLISLIALILILTACEDLLTEKPKAIASETFYNTSEEVAAAANAMYYPFKVQNFENIWFFNECYVDYGYGRGSWASNSDYQGLDATNVTRMSQFWSQSYLAIRNANLVIINTPKGTKTTDQQKNQFIAEAKFIRAFTYFLLVRSYGGVPLRTEETFNQLDLPRSTIDKVYELIVNDLNFAEANLPDNPRLIGTPSKWAAKTLLADVYITLKNYDKSLALAKEVIDSKKYSLVKISSSDDWNNIFGPNVVTTSEEIFYLKFNSVQGSTVGMMAHHPKSSYLNGRGWYGLYTTTDNTIMANWDNNDLRKKGWFYSWNIGLGSNTLLYKKYVDPATTHDASANDFPVYRYPDVLFMYAESANFVNNGPTDEAMECVNKVHRRAYGLDPTLSSSIDFKTSYYTKDSFFDLIIRERGYETFFEGKRWWELVRTGRVKEIIKTAKGKEIADKHFLAPIPVSETNYNKAIDPIKNQNPGY